jgi:23S rRNA (adenine2030-N6)-methyltransferase
VNYRHHYHAGNFADVLKHTVLLALVGGLQRKEKGFLFLDTHAGRGAYDLSEAEHGDSLAREPEWPEGIGRLETPAPEGRPAPVEDYLAAVRAFAEARGGVLAPAGGDAAVMRRPYPGSPWLVYGRLRLQDRMLLYERHPEEHAALAAEFARVTRVRVAAEDGYGAIRANLPPRERRALVLIDPPFEAMDEFAHITAALGEGLRRLPSGTFAVWYPLTERARVDDFLAGLTELALPPSWTIELNVVGMEDPRRMKGCGVLVLNPPWQLDRVLSPVASWLAETLGQTPAAQGTLRWIVPE